MLMASKSGERASTNDREDQPQRRAAAGEHEAFGQHLANQTPAARAQRRADGDFLLPHGRARQQKIREVRAHNQHDHARVTRGT